MTAIETKPEAVDACTRSTGKAECPLCAARDAARYHSGGERVFHRCDRCALIFLRADLRPRPLEEALRYLHHRNDPDDGYVRFLRRLADPLLAVLDDARSARGLDFGCGPTTVLADILTASGCRMVSYDPLFHPNDELLAESYDFVTSSEVMEHVHDPCAALDLFARLLRDGGTLALMTRFRNAETPFESWWYHRDLTHVSFYSADTMRWIAETRGWKLHLPAPDIALFTIPAT